MRLSDKLIEAAEWWISWPQEETSNVCDADDHITRVYGDLHTSERCYINSEEECYLALLEAEFQKDLEEYEFELSLHL